MLATIAADPALASATAVIITADHGGPLGLTDHSEETDDENYTVPFIVWGPDVVQGDLYSLNAGARVDPGTGRPDEDGVQPVRAAEAGNLALQLLGLPPITGSRYNSTHDLNLG